MDPWGTSDYCAVWLQSIIKNLALGDTIGEAYEKGIRACAPELLVDHWWWDTWENVCFFGDPNVRVYVPSTDYSNENYWSEEETRPLRYDAELNVDGHMPFGATGYPHEKKPTTFLDQYLWLIVILALIFIIILVMIAPRRKK